MPGGEWGPAGAVPPASPAAVALEVQVGGGGGGASSCDFSHEGDEVPPPTPAGQDVLRKGGAHVRDIISSLIPSNRNGRADS